MASDSRSDGRAVPQTSSRAPRAVIDTLGKVADMQAKPTGAPTGSPVPGVIPEPIRVRHETVAENERDGATIDPAPTPRRRNPASILLAKVLSALRGDKYMVGAYPPGKER